MSDPEVSQTWYAPSSSFTFLLKLTSSKARQVSNRLTLFPLIQIRKLRLGRSLPAHLSELCSLPPGSVQILTLASVPTALALVRSYHPVSPLWQSVSSCLGYHSPAFLILHFHILVLARTILLDRSCDHVIGSSEILGWIPSDIRI